MVRVVRVSVVREPELANFYSIGRHDLPVGFANYINEKLLLLYKMSIPNKEGVYLLRSYSAEGTLYKIGRTTDLKGCLSKYSPNYILITFALTDNSEEVKTRLLFAFNNRYKLYGGKEYFVGGVNEFYVVNLFNRIVHSINQPQDKDQEINRLTEDNLLLQKELSEAKEEQQKLQRYMKNKGLLEV